jgi:hypothetical protein
MPHSFHIPVLGLSYSIDTPVKVARFGISSVVSIVEDELIEKMREYYCLQTNEEYIAITVKDEDYRARRITAYLDLLNRIVNRQIETLKRESFEEENSEIVKYFDMLPADSSLRKLYETSDDKEPLRKYILPGAIDVNIMSKIDNNSDALAALRGVANSTLKTSVVLSAGYNPRLYNYVATFSCFRPEGDKKIILKVSDYRSALVQGKLLAKKGIWVSEYRIESGLNCGGHAFATEGMLLGPILEEFRQKRDVLRAELEGLVGVKDLPLRITVQGGIGTANEDRFMTEYYGVDGTGWGSPFLLVPEATNVEDHTLQQLASAQKEDYFLSKASPLGVAFQNFRPSTAEEQRKLRIEKNRPGSPCYKKFLASNTEFTDTPICTASRQYQDLKVKQLKSLGLPAEQLQKELDVVMSKDCLCEGLSVSVYLKNKMPVAHHLTAVTICPGPNLAYFSGVFSLKQMVDHIYGKVNILNALPRPNMFVNEIQLYIDYLKTIPVKQKFKDNLLEGIEYYKNLLPAFKRETRQYLKEMLDQLNGQRQLLLEIN